MASGIRGERLFHREKKHKKPRQKGAGKKGKKAISFRVVILQVPWDSWDCLVSFG
jgi:hypothetical protein